MKMRNIFFILIFFLKLCIPLFSETSGQTEEFVSDKNEVPVEADYENVKDEESVIPENEENNDLFEKNEEKIDSSYVPVFYYFSSDYKFEPVEIPEMKRPKKPDAQKVLEAESKDDSETSFSETEKIIKYGTSSEISDVINKILENDDPRYGDILYDLFQVSKNVDIRTKILEYFTKQKDDCLAGYALEILNDPYDYPNKTVENVFRYVSEIELKKACPCVIEILETGNENYFNAAISVIGKI